MAGSSLLSKIRRPELARPRSSYSESEVRDSILQNLDPHVLDAGRFDAYLPGLRHRDVSEMVYLFPDAITLMAQSASSHHPDLRAAPAERSGRAHPERDHRAHAAVRSARAAQ